MFFLVISGKIRVFPGFFSGVVFFEGKKKGRKRCFQGFQRVPCFLEVLKYLSGLPKSMAPLKPLVVFSFFSPA